MNYSKRITTPLRLIAESDSYKDSLSIRFENQRLRYSTYLQPNGITLILNSVTRDVTLVSDCKEMGLVRRVNGENKRCSESGKIRLQ